MQPTVKKLLILLTLIIVPWLSTSLANNRIKLPDIGSSSGIIISTQIEKKLGKLFIRSIRRSVPLIEDPEINEYIQTLGNRIAKASEQPDRYFHFFGVADRRINAFAGPDANIGINAGLIMATETESELASVFAHEVGHVTQHHLQRSIESTSNMSLPNAAATLAAVVLGIAVPGIGPAAVIAVQAGSVQKQINFTRAHEAEADRVGIQTLYDAGLDPRSMPIFFGRLQAATRNMKQKVPEILRTHPAPISRISDTAARAEKFPFKQVSDSQDFRLIKMKVRLATKLLTTQELISTLKDEAKRGINEQKAAAEYGLALLYTDSQQFHDARQILSQLTKQFPLQKQYLTAFALNEHAAGLTKKASALFDLAIKRFPHSRAVNLLYAQFLLQIGKPQLAITLLDKDLKNFPATPRVYDQLSIAYGKIKSPVRGFQYKAEYFYSIGRTRDAIVQLEQALLAANDNFYFSSQVENRINYFQNELREEKKGFL